VVLELEETGAWFCCCVQADQSFLWLHYLPKQDKIFWQQTTCALIRNCWSKPSYNKKEERIYKLTFQWDCEGLRWAKTCIHRRDHCPMIHSHPPSWGYNKTNEVLRFITVPIHNSLAPLRVLDPFDHVVCWIAEATGKLWWDGGEQPGLDVDGIILSTQSLTALKGITSKTREQDRWGNSKAAWLLQLSH
jgi:hypothetical protein